MKISVLFGLCMLFLCSCAAFKTKTNPALPISLIVETDVQEFRNYKDYSGKLIRLLEKYSAVDLEMSAEGASTVQLTVNISDFSVSTSSQLSSVRTFTKRVQDGINTDGKPLYKTIQAYAEEIRTTTRALASFKTTLVIKDSPEPLFPLNFSDTVYTRNVYLRNFQGERAALDASVSSQTTPPVVNRNDILLGSSTQKAMRAISREIRSYYLKLLR